MRKKALALIVTGIMAASLAACGSSSASAGNSQSSSSSDGTAASAVSGSTGSFSADGSLTEVTLGTTSWPTNMFYYLAEDQGFFEKYGVKVKIQDFSSTTESTNAFVGGKLDFVTFASSETISPFEEGADYKIVMESDKSNGCEGLVATSDIKSVEDLKGKTVATQMYSVDHMLLLTLLNDHNMTQDDINLVDMSIQEAGNAFVAGQCDAACIWDPYFSQAKAAGGNVLFSSADNPDLITDVLGASSDMCENHPDAVKGVIQGFMDAVDYWKNNEDTADEFMGKKLGVDADEFKSEMEGLIVPTLDDEVTAFTKADDYSYWGYTQNQVRDFMYNLGALDSKDKDCGDMIDSSFVSELAGKS